MREHPPRGLGVRVAAPLLVLLAALPVSAASPARGERAMVVASQADAARAGLAMLETGGNAVDAAVATAFALGVTQPFSAGIGGGAFLLVRTGDGKVVAVDARETAPAAATRDMYVRPGAPEGTSLWGPLAVATPGFVAGCALALERWGSMSLEEVLAPAIELAEQGFPIGPYHARMLERVRRSGLPERFPETARIQLPPPGVPAEPGWILVQRDLARTLRRIAREGPESFYGGRIARAIADEMVASGGILRPADLEAYRPVVREPVRGSYRGIAVSSFPPPSSGGVALVEALNILEGFGLAALGAGSPAGAHRIVEALKLSFRDRAAYLGDPDFAALPVARLTSKDYARALRARIEPAWWTRPPWRWFDGDRALRVEGSGVPPNDAGTTHLSIVDAAGGAVALTMSINTPFGSGITVPRTGIVLNNEMDDFSVARDTPNVYGLVDTSGANAVAPRKRPLSSMTPTILEREGEVFMVTGSPGGPRIISATLLSVVNVVDYGMDVEQAVSRPRFHHQWQPDEVDVEPGVPEALLEGLRARGHEVEVGARPWSAVEAIVVDPRTGVRWGANDPRRDGLAVGF